MSVENKKPLHLGRLEFSPNVNPLVEPNDIDLKRRRVRTGLKQDLVDPTTGLISGAATIHTIEEKDDEEFVKVFAAGIKATYDLTKSAHRVFQAIMDVYQDEPMTGGFADSIYLHFFDGGLSGKKIDMSEYTFKRGLRELLQKGFIAPRMSSMFWVNPSLFFKGNRVMFLKEYRRKSTSKDEAERANLEAKGQQRLDV